MEEFAKATRSLTKNPLGVIGLFIVLVYGFACLVLGLASTHLESTERYPLIWFIVLFPILILGVFFRLVTAHHKKLYAPSDFKDESNFMSEPLSDQRRSERLESEVRRIEEESALLPQDTPPSAPAQSAPSILPHQNIQPMKVTDDSARLNIRATYADAERLAFLELENEIGKPFQKYVQVSAHGRNEEFDGVLVTDKESHLVEVKYFSKPTFKREFLEAVIHRASSFLFDKTFDEKTDRERIILWIAIVIGFPEDQLPEFRKKIESSVRCTLFDVKLRFYPLKDLKAKYG